MATPKKYYATRDFTDAGLEKKFTAGDDVSAEPAIDNYLAAGLATDQKSEVVPSDAPASGDAA